MSDLSAEAEVRERITFTLNWAEVDPTIQPLLSDLAPKRTWLRWEKEGALEGIFLHTVSAGAHAINCAFARDRSPLSHRREAVTRGLQALSLTPPYDNLPLYAGMLSQLAFNAQVWLDRPVEMCDLPLREDQVAPEHLLAATEAAFGFTLSFLKAYDFGWNKYQE